MATTLDPPVTCKCGLTFTTLEAAKVHYLVYSILPWKHAPVKR